MFLVVQSNPQRLLYTVMRFSNTFQNSMPPNKYTRNRSAHRYSHKQHICPDSSLHRNFSWRLFYLDLYKYAFWIFVGFCSVFTYFKLFNISNTIYLTSFFFIIIGGGSSITLELRLLPVLVVLLQNWLFQHNLKDAWRRWRGGQARLPL